MFLAQYLLTATYMIGRQWSGSDQRPLTVTNLLYVTMCQVLRCYIFTCMCHVYHNIIHGAVGIYCLFPCIYKILMCQGRMAILNILNTTRTYTGNYLSSRGGVGRNSCGLWFVIVVHLPVFFHVIVGFIWKPTWSCCTNWAPSHCNIASAMWQTLPAVIKAGELYHPSVRVYGINYFRYSDIKLCMPITQQLSGVSLEELGAVLGRCVCVCYLFNKWIVSVRRPLARFIQFSIELYSHCDCIAYSRACSQK